MNSYSTIHKSEILTNHQNNISSKAFKIHSILLSFVLNEINEKNINNKLLNFVAKDRAIINREDEINIYNNNNKQNLIKEKKLRNVSISSSDDEESSSEMSCSEEFEN